MNKYVFPGADASCSLGWVVNQVEAAGFEVKNIDVLGVHYSATIWKWYLNWVDNRDKIVEKYGERSVIPPCQHEMMLIPLPLAGGIVSGYSSLPTQLSSRVKAPLLSSS